ncbi:Non-histone protein 10 [Pleurostoma richardsiae]|uniref:Non-histone protein 10 n=1 Tax=Pleurostoma richardsiae TaxID=41990 RepID=A0AA38VJV6_9PEZI|nr:Non-histone protein 10 [Pleurostoma richardsiae]
MAPSNAIPPALPPSVEEAYRRKCLQLKQRTGEVEEANDAARARLVRLKRQVEKMRVERAFLLEQLAKRTSTNVEDSEGSPSPPPTVRQTSPLPAAHAHHHHHRGSRSPSSASGLAANLHRQPTAKPLRTKRGHRKPSLAPGGSGGLDAASAAPGSTFINQSVNTLSPSSDAFSHTHADSQKEPKDQKDGAEHEDDEDEAAPSSSSRANGVSKPPKKPVNAFELYCADARPKLLADKEEGDAGSSSIEEELARGWKDLPETEKEEYQTRHDEELAKYQKEKEAYEKKSKAEAAEAKAADPPAAESQAEDTPARDEDVEMANYDTEQDTPGVEKHEE